MLIEKNMSYSPFSFGIRKCPGQTFALFETKVVLAYLFTHIDYEVSQSLLDNDNARFYVGTNFVLNARIKKL